MRNELYISLKVSDHTCMKLTISLFNVESSKLVPDNVRYLPLLRLQFSFQFVVLDGKHSDCHYYNKQFKILHLIYVYIADKITDIANSFM